ncbi:uncharacterized protein LOC142233573 [Haematobia irritans]|uniref:uncharacterized protein LOC142233573 n=1 Tax=Haematobia irritans TaxID=7368 RepID=UPI003F501838
MDKKCICPVETNTTQHQDYKQLEATKPIEIYRKPSACDQELISGHIGNNLHVKGQGIKSKVWPEVLKNTEEYEEFLQRLKNIKADIYNLYYKCHPIDKPIIEKMFANLSKSSYQLVFSPNHFISRNEKRYLTKAPLDSLIKMKYQLTTYGSYYGRLKELEMFRDALKITLIKGDKIQLKSELKKIYRCGRSTYNDTISKTAAIYSKKTLPGPIDRYTERRI